MKKVLILILSLAFMSACADDKQSMGEGRNPLSDIVLTESAASGEEVVIQWNGFDSGVTVFLVDKAGNEYETEIRVVTSSGLIFIVPDGILPGEYSVLVGQKQNIGTITVLQSDMPVTGISFPVAVSPGEIFSFSGIGLDSSFELILFSADGRLRLDTELSSIGLDCFVPSDFKTGVYTLILTDGENEWIVSDSFKVMKRKKLLAVWKEEPYDEDVRVRGEYRLEFQESELKAVVYRSCLLQGGQVIEEQSFDRYVKISDDEYAVEGEEISSLNYGFKYTCASDGKILSADVHRYSNKNPEGIHRDFTWMYDESGLPVAVTYVLDGVTRSLQNYIYENGNLLETNRNVFVYEDVALENNPFGPDAAHAFDMMNYKDEPFLYFPYLLGNHPFVSRLLPDGYMAISGQSSRVKVPFTYEYDEDGYISSMSWVEDRTNSCEIVFEYQSKP